MSFLFYRGNRHPVFFLCCCHTCITGMLFIFSQSFIINHKDLILNSITGFLNIMNSAVFEGKDGHDKC